MEDPSPDRITEVLHLLWNILYIHPNSKRGRQNKADSRIVMTYMFEKVLQDPDLYPLACNVAKKAGPKIHTVPEFAVKYCEYPLREACNEFFILYHEKVTLWNKA